MDDSMVEQILSSGLPEKTKNDLMTFMEVRLDSGFS